MLACHEILESLTTAAHGEIAPRRPGSRGNRNLGKQQLRNYGRF